MTVRRLLSVLSVCVIATASVVAAQPKKAAKAGKKGAVAPAKDAASAGSGSDAGSGSAMPAPPEEPPPKDMNGVDENPDAPKTADSDNAPTVVVPVKKEHAGYPIEEALRPITLPQNMSEISIGPHFVSSPFYSSDALRFRYGITRQVQFGLTYVFAGIYDDPATLESKIALHGGKAVGLDVTILLQNWIALKVGVPVYVQPLAFSLALGAPIKFILTDKLAIGGLDDLLNIKLKRFAPSLTTEFANAAAAAVYATDPNSEQSRGVLRISTYGIYQYEPRIAIIGRFGFNLDDFGSGKTDIGQTTTFIRGGFDWTPRHWVDLGLSLGFDDLSIKGSFGLAGNLAIRI